MRQGPRRPRFYLGVLLTGFLLGGFLNAFLKGEVTRLVVLERLATPPSSQIASGWFPKFLKDLFSGPERTAASQPERAIGYAAVSN